MLYRLLFVDDEKVIRDGLEKAVDWQSVGFVVAGKAANGRKALEFIAENPVDVVLTDIRMPLMSGIELLEILNRDYPEIRTLILSGYGEFEYARSAITYGACGYVLKPSKEDELIAEFGRVRQMLDARSKGRPEAAPAAATKCGAPDPSCDRLPNSEEAALLVKAVLGDDERGIEESIDRAFHMFIDANLTHLEPAFAFVYRLIFLLEKELSRHAVVHEDALNLDGFITRMRSACHLYEIRDGLSARLQAMRVAFRNFRADSPDRFVRNAMDILNNEYSKPTLSLQTVSQSLNISSAYLSRLFKKHTGTTFMRCLADRRIEAAKTLLEDVGYKVYEVATMVGYSDQRHFSEVFSEKTGLTPAEYRKGLKN